MNTVDALLRTFSMKTKIMSDYDLKGIFVNRDFPISLVIENKNCYVNPNLNLVDENNEKLLPLMGNLCIP